MKYDRLIKECFWDYHFTDQNIEKLLHSNDFHDKQFLYEKILVNSTDLLGDMQLFDRDDLKKLTETYKVPSFNREYIRKRHNIVEYFFFNKPLQIDELKWVA